MRHPPKSFEKHLGDKYLLEYDHVKFNAGERSFWLDQSKWIFPRKGPAANSCKPIKGSGCHIRENGQTAACIDACEVVSLFQIENTLEMIGAEHKVTVIISYDSRHKDQKANKYKSW